jgi:hypothetical protein
VRVHAYQPGRRVSPTRRPAHHGSLARTPEAGIPACEFTSDETPLPQVRVTAGTIIHSDFHAKNLIHGIGGRIVPVDWPGAYVHPHLGGRW